MGTKLPRSAWVYWLGCLLLAAVTGLLIGKVAADAKRAEARYGQQQAVVVATERIDVGRRVDRRNTEVRRWPAGLVPPGSLSSVPALRTALAAIEKDEPVARNRLSGTERTGPAALMPKASRAVAVPVPVAGLPLAPGDRVDLLPTASSSAGSAPASTKREGDNGPVTTGAVVIAVGHQTVTVAVTAEDLSAVTGALGQPGGVVVALHAPGG